MFELKAVPQSWTRQVHIDLRIALYNSNLFSIEKSPNGFSDVDTREN